MDFNQNKPPMHDVCKRLYYPEKHSMILAGLFRRPVVLDGTIMNMTWPMMFAAFVYHRASTVAMQITLFMPIPCE